MESDPSDPYDIISVLRDVHPMLLMRESEKKVEEQRRTLKRSKSKSLQSPFYQAMGMLVESAVEKKEAKVKEREPADSDSDESGFGSDSDDSDIIEWLDLKSDPEEHGPPKGPPGFGFDPFGTVVWLSPWRKCSDPFPWSMSIWEEKTAKEKDKPKHIIEWLDLKSEPEEHGPPKGPPDFGFDPFGTDPTGERSGSLEVLPPDL